MQKTNVKRRVLLIAPYSNHNLRVGQYLSPPFGLYRIASYISECADVKVYDPNLNGLSRLYKLINENNYDIIGFSLLYPTLKNDLKIIFSVKKTSPNSLFIAGGQGASFIADFLLENTPIDVIIKGFGEEAMKEIVTKLQNKRENLDNLLDIPGLVIKYKKNEIRKSSDSSNNNNNKIKVELKINDDRLNEINRLKEIIHTNSVENYSQEQFSKISNMIDLSSIPYEEYWNVMEKIYSSAHLSMMRNNNLLYTVRLMASSHCNNGCTFCSSTNMLSNATCNSQKVLSISAEDIVKLIYRAADTHPKVRAVFFNDDDFLQDRDRLIKLCKLIKPIKGFSYFCLSNIQNIDSEMLSAMKAAGFELIIYGVESFSKQVLESMNKIKNKQYPAKASDVIKQTIENGITPLMNIILFHPSATIDDITNTIESCIELVELGARLTVYPYIEVYPGASMFNSKEHNYTYQRFCAGNKLFVVPQYVVPKHNDIKLISGKSIKLRERIIESIALKYKWNGVVPHPVYGLSLFLAVYQMIGRDTKKIESIVDAIMCEHNQTDCLKSIEVMTKNESQTWI